jgi:hypothetical protein
MRWFTKPEKGCAKRVALFHALSAENRKQFLSVGAFVGEKPRYSRVKKADLRKICRSSHIAAANCSQYNRKF